MFDVLRTHSSVTYDVSEVTDEWVIDNHLGWRGCWALLEHLEERIEIKPSAKLVIDSALTPHKWTWCEDYDWYEEKDVDSRPPEFFQRAVPISHQCGLGLVRYGGFWGVREGDVVVTSGNDLVPEKGMPIDPGKVEAKLTEMKTMGIKVIFLIWGREKRQYGMEEFADAGCR